MRYIKYGDWESEAYGALVENVYRETAAIVSQRAFRKAHPKDGDNNKYLEHVHHIQNGNYDKLDFRDPNFTPNLLRALKENHINLDQLKIADEKFIAAQKSLHKLIQEPLDEKYLEHVARIETGNYQALDFADQHFIRNIFKALRLDKITLDQMFMALSIYQAKEWLHHYDYPADQISMQSFKDKNTPYQISFIDAMTALQQQAFLDGLEPKDEMYATVNLSKFQEALIFSNAFIGYFSKSSLFDQPRFCDALLKFLEHSEGLSDEDTSLIKFGRVELGRWGKLPMQHGDFSNALEELVIKVCQKPAEAFLALPEAQRKREIDTAKAFLGVIEIGCFVPLYGVSGDYRESDSNTPTLCFVIPTLTAEMQIQTALYQDEATYPVISAGALNTRLIRALDERPTKAASPQLYSHL